VCPIHQDYTRVSLAGRGNLLNAIGDYFADLGIAGLSRLSWIDEESIDAAQALALRERMRPFYPL